MFSQLHPKVAVGVVLVLLLFTSADLLGDLVGAPICSSDSAVELHEYLPHDGAEADDLPHESSPHPEQHHVEDCFCCSHCVQHATAFVLASAESVALVDRDSTILNLPGFVHELLRPPQAS